MRSQIRLGSVRFSVLGSAISAVLVGASFAYGQQPAAQGDQVEEVVVTGSRIVRRDFSANSPIMTIDEARFEESSTIAMETVLNQMPQFVPSVTQFQTVPPGLGSNDGSPSATQTAATVSLRGLGRNRNLVLLDGRRAMPIDASMAVNINGIPSAAIARVETITGGASSVYGADAVAGVVNFVMKRDFEGFDFDLQYGVTEEGDADEYNASVLFGANVGDGGNVMIGMERYERGQILQQDRDFYLEGWEDTGSQGGLQVFYTAPHYSVDPLNPPSQQAVDAVFAGAPPGSVNGRAGNFYLNGDGTLYKTAPDGNFRYNGPTRTADGLLYRFIRDDNGSLAENWIDEQQSAPLSRSSIFGRAHIPLSDNVTVFGQLLFTESDSQHRERIVGMIGGWGGTVPHGNGVYAPSVDANGNTLPEYLPGGPFGLNCPAVGGCTKSQAWPKSPELQMLLDSRPDPEAPAAVGTAASWDGNQLNNVATQTYQFIVGLEGELDFKDWTWDLHISKGVSRTQNELIGGISLQRWRNVIAQPNYGTGLFLIGNPEGDNFGAGAISCTSGFAFLGQREQYLHPSLGLPDSMEKPSEDCRDAIGIAFSMDGWLSQTVSEFNLQGNIAELPAGQLQFALGAAHRENDFRWLPPPIVSRESVYDVVVGISARSETQGSIAATDVYGELLVPLIADKPFVENMSLELGYRYSDNDPTESVDSYKALLDWQVHPRVRLRGGHQVANRAPNVAELYDSGIRNFFTTNDGDWCSDLNPINTLSPNPALNSNAAQARALCSALMGPSGAAEFYSDPDRNDGTLQYLWAFVQGNPNVEHETASTTTFGVVADITDRLTLTADYWSIKIDNMISPETPSVVYQQCLSPVSNPTFDPMYPACRDIVRDPGTGAPGTMETMFGNEGAADFAGYDVSLNWSTDVGPGQLNLDALVTIADKMKTRVGPDAEWNDWKGTSGPTDLLGVDGWSFDYRSFVTANYSLGSWVGTLRWRHLPSIESEAALNNPLSTFEPTNSYNVFDFAGRYSSGGMWSLRFGVDNLFNTDPKRTFPEEDNTATGQTNSNFYDILGRRYYVGMSLQF